MKARADLPLREKEATEHLALLDHLYRTAPIGMCLMDRELRFVHINERLADFNGFPAAEHIGRTLAEVVPDIARVVGPVYRQVIETGEPVVDREVQVKPPTSPDEERHFQVSYYPLKADDGTVQGVSTFVHDVTVRRRAESLVTGQKRVLELLAQGESLADVLGELARTIDKDHGVRCALQLMDDQGEHLHSMVGPHLPREVIEALDGLRIGPSAGSCGTAAYRRQRVVVSDISRDPLCICIRDLALRFNLRACWSQPIMSRSGRVLGTICVFYDRPREPNKTEIELGEQAAYIAGVAIDHSRDMEALKDSESALRQSQEALQHLAGKLLTVKEEEQRRLARELHDDVTQRLAALAIEAGKLGKQSTGIQEPIRSSLLHMQEQLARLSEDIHGISRQLHPSIIADLGLVDAMAAECARFSDLEGISTSFTARQVPDQVPSDVAICLYRVLQESLRNIAKHSQAKQAQVTLAGIKGCIRLTIQDSGAGFDTDAVRGRSGLGLASMEERVRQLMGDLFVSSRPGKGTTIEASVALENGN